MDELGFAAEGDQAAGGELLNVMGDGGGGELEPAADVVAGGFAARNHFQGGETAGVGYGFGDLLELCIVHTSMVSRGKIMCVQDGVRRAEGGIHRKRGYA